VTYLYLYANISKTRQFVPDRLYIVELQSGVAAEFLYKKIANGNS